MVYKFHIVSDEVEDFRRIIEIDADDTFLSLRNAILESVGYKKDQMDSFFICDEDWNKEKEVTLADMGTDSDEDIWLMDETKMSDLIEEEDQKLLFVFDYLTERAFFMEMKELITGKDLKQPLCSLKKGQAEPQFVDFNDFEAKQATATSTDFDVDDDFYGEDSYNEDELDAEGFGDYEFDEK